MTETVLDIAPWAVEGAEAWVWHRRYRSSDDWAEHATVIRSGKTRVAVECGDRTQVFAPRRGKLLEHPRKDSITPDDELLAVDDPRLPGIIDAQLKQANACRAKSACDDFRKKPDVELARIAVAALTAYIDAHQEES